jgi:hypothetical protein
MLISWLRGVNVVLDREITTLIRWNYSLVFLRCTVPWRLISTPVLMDEESHVNYTTFCLGAAEMQCSSTQDQSPLLGFFNNQEGELMWLSCHFSLQKYWLATTRSSEKHCKAGRRQKDGLQNVKTHLGLR